MSDKHDSIPAEALEDVAYLSRSANRIEILQALTRRPHTRRDLAEVTGASRTTLDRVVNELEDRGWARRTADGDYTSTPAGDHLMAELLQFVESVEAIRRLDETVAWLPSDELSIGLHHFSDASVLRPEHDDPMETADYIATLMEDTAEFRALTHFTPPLPLAEAMRERIVAQRLTAEYVITDGLIEYLREQPERRDRWWDILRGGADMYRVRGSVPCNLWILDDIVLIKKSGPDSLHESYGVPIQSENETVLSWAHDLFDRYRANATRVDAATFAEDVAGGRTDSDTG